MKKLAIIACVLAAVVAGCGDRVSDFDSSDSTTGIPADKLTNKQIIAEVASCIREALAEWGSDVVIWKGDNWLQAKYRIGSIDEGTPTPSRDAATNSGQGYYGQFEKNSVSLLLRLMKGQPCGLVGILVREGNIVTEEYAYVLEWKKPVSFYVLLTYDYRGEKKLRERITDAIAAYAKERK